MFRSHDVYSFIYITCKHIKSLYCIHKYHCWLHACEQQVWWSSLSLSGSCAVHDGRTCGLMKYSLSLQRANTDGVLLPGSSSGLDGGDVQCVSEVWAALTLWRLRKITARSERVEQQTSFFSAWMSLSVLPNMAAGGGLTYVELMAKN